MNFITPEDLLILFGFQNIPREAKVLLDYREKPAVLLFSSPAGSVTLPPGTGSYLFIFTGESPQNIIPWPLRPHCWMLWSS